MQSTWRSGGCLLTAVALVVQPLPAWSQDQTVELRSQDNGYTSYALTEDVTQVDLLDQLQGTCRFNRTWGFDLTNRELWVDGGCGGRFKITRPAQRDTASQGSNVALAAAAVAAIAGIALLSSHNRKDDPGQAVPPGPYPPSGGYRGQVIRGLGGLCLDVADGRVRPGARLTVSHCHGQINQRFTWGRGGELMVGNHCLDIEGANRNDGARVITWNCSGAPNQRWRVSGNQIVSVLNGKCLDVSDNRGRPGQPVVVWGCHNGQNQRWWW